MANNIRLKRISDRIREDLSKLLVRQVADPRLAGIAITDVKVDRELAFADIFVSAVEGGKRANEVLGALQHASGFLRTSLAESLDLRSMPRLRFHWDPTPEHADHIEQILLELRKEREAHEAAAPESGGEDQESQENE